jgi:hypothetical protein
MSTINPQLPAFQAAQAQMALGQSLRNLSAQAQSAAVQDPGDGGLESADSFSTADSGDASALSRQIAQQNQASALADPAEAAAANQSAIANLFASPGSALGAQSNLDAEIVRQLVSGS